MGSSCILQRSTPKKRAISTCYENEFYRYIGDDGTPNDEVEHWMAKEIEGPFNELLPLFESSFHFQSHNHFRVIARYVANIFSRSNQRRIASHRQQQKVAEIAMHVVNNPKMLRQLTAAFSFVSQCQVSSTTVRQALINLNWGDSHEARTAHYLRNVRMYEEDIVRMLAGKPYGLLRAPDTDSFILGDTVVLTRQPIGNALSVGVGFAKPNMHVLLPISPRTCIQIGIPGREEHVLMPEEVRSINTDQIKMMHRYAYSRVESDEIQEQVSNMGGTLNYMLSAFIVPELKSEDLLDHFVRDLLDGKPLFVVETAP
jgi:hypothetical protein